MEYYSTINGSALHISDSKKGKTPILLLHGYLETLYVWEELSIELEKRDFRVISIDIPGHGFSSFKEDEDVIDFAAHSVNELLLSLGLKDVIVVGHSMGGYVAQKAIKENISLYKGLIMINSNTLADDAQKKSERDREIAVIEEGKLLTLATVSLPKICSTGNLRKFDEVIEDLISACELHDPQGIIAAIKGMTNRDDYTAYLAGNVLPALFIFGEEDPIFPLEYAQWIQKHIPDATYHFVKNSAHLSFIEQKEEVLDKMTEWIESLS